MAFFVLPHLPIMYTPGYSDDLFINQIPKLISCLLIFPNVALSIFGNIPYASPSWSIGVEEQFYILWPLLIALSSRLYRSIGVFILFFIALKVSMFVIGRAELLPVETFVRVKDLVVATRMECMGIGGLGAVLLFNDSRLLQYLNRKLELLLIVSVFIALYFSSKMFELHHIVLSVIFLGIILHAVCLRDTSVKLENRFFITMGKLSYGIYMYHTICITIAFKLLYQSPLVSSVPFKNVLLYISSFLLAITFAAISYRFLESWFLKAKVRYAKVISGDAAKS
jgi:peptidoglycan/LPS O-acetylase OafA/YrhL